MTYQYVPVHTSTRMYQCTSMYWYVLVCTGMYWYVLVCTDQCGHRVSWFAPRRCHAATFCRPCKHGGSAPHPCPEDEEFFECKADRRASPGEGWAPDELNHILQAHVVDGSLTTFGCVEWESESGELCAPDVTPSKCQSIAFMVSIDLQVSIHFMWYAKTWYAKYKLQKLF